jgi:hypothetical protein
MTGIGMSLETIARHPARLELSANGLVWNDRKVRSTGNLHHYLAERGVDSRHLAKVITLSVDPAIEDSSVQSFLEQLCTYLPGEFRRRERRMERFVELGLFDKAEVEEFVHGHRDAQPWLIYYSENGGLGPYDQTAFSRCADQGMVPCFALRNHGVAWQRSPSGGYSTMLVTSRKPGQDWEWDSDVGHESAHAAFSPVPLFTLPAEQLTEPNRLSALGAVDDLTTKHLASICYLCSELAVVSLRGEPRETQSGLPTTESSKDLPVFFDVCHELLPGFGFDRARTAFQRVNGVIDCNNGDEIFEIGAPAIKTVGIIYPEFNRFVVPTARWLRSLAP